MLWRPFIVDSVCWNTNVHTIKGKTLDSWTHSTQLGKLMTTVLKCAISFCFVEIEDWAHWLQLTSEGSGGPRRGTASWPTLRVENWPTHLGLEIGLHYTQRVQKLL